MASRSTARALLQRLIYNHGSIRSRVTIRYTRTGNFKAILIPELRRILGEDLPDLTNDDYLKLAREASQLTILHIKKNPGLYNFLHPIVPGHIRFYSSTLPLRTKRGLTRMNTFLRKGLYVMLLKIFRAKVEGEDPEEVKRLATEYADKVRKELQLQDAFTRVSRTSASFRDFYEKGNIIVSAKYGGRGKFNTGTFTFNWDQIRQEIALAQIPELVKRLDRDSLFIRNLIDIAGIEPTVEHTLTDVMADFLRQNIRVVNETTITAAIDALVNLRGRAARVIGPTLNASTPGPLPSGSNEARQSNSKFNLTAIKNEINRRLHSEIRERMGHEYTGKRDKKGKPIIRERLVYQTGRFARTAKVRWIAPSTRQGRVRNTVYFGYKKPYGVFDHPESETSGLATPDRDPRNELLIPAIFSILRDLQSRIYGGGFAARFRIDRDDGREGTV